ncbi:hypothetical protein [Azospirillum brasilense]|uniref:hypothetical protein n=1 Tax=Azospirillum brasilense TaxID=192 RepID=UPI001EDA7C87|nr:hypothetical protein [Azospirillum brasilense]UKJ78001.1 hypothetical protein H1Q64_30870 [Azospirillum brasilense]
MGFSAASDRPGRLICFLEKVFFAPANIIQKTNRNPYCQSLVLIPWREAGVGVKPVLKPVNRPDFAEFADEIPENTKRILGSAFCRTVSRPRPMEKGSCARRAGRATVAVQARLSG